MAAKNGRKALFGNVASTHCRYENSKWPPLLGEKIFRKKKRVDYLDTLGVKNFGEFTLSRTVKEIEANLCFSIFGENSKWPSFLGREKSFENWQE